MLTLASGIPASGLASGVAFNNSNGFVDICFFYIGHSFPVIDKDHRLASMVSITDYERALEEGEPGGRLVADIATRDDIMVAYEDESLSDALQRIGTRDINK